LRLWTIGFIQGLSSRRCVGLAHLVLRHMNNFVNIRVPSVSFSSETIQGQTIYRGVFEFEDQMGERLRTSLSASSILCGPVQRSFKPGGSGFNADCTPGRYWVTVSIERTALPGAEVTISAWPRRNAVESWTRFEPLFRRAVEFAFPDCDLRWMSVDEYIETGPSA
jgi:hypothetical protein